MVKSIAMRNLDCANCAEKMQNKISKLNGVVKVNISFLTQKMFLEVNDEHWEDIRAKIPRIIKKIEPGCEVIL